MVSQAWNDQQTGTPMFQVCRRIRACRIALLKLKGLLHLSSGQAICDIKRKMELMQNEGGSRDWLEWNHLKHELGVQYQKEEVYWRQKSRVQWLQEGDRNSKFFYAFVTQRRQRNCIERLVTEHGVECNTTE